jgi:uncharacterized protein HemX
MNSVTHHHAGTKAGQIARCALRSVLACALVLGASGAAFAQQYGGDRQYERHDDQAMQQASRGDRATRYLPPERDPRYDVRAYEEQRRAQQQQYQDQRQDGRQDGRDRRGGGASGRMTPDERRDLRRQINEAGMDLYPPRR